MLFALRYLVFRPERPAEVIDPLGLAEEQHPPANSDPPEQARRQRLVAGT